MSETENYTQWIQKIEQVLTQANKLPIVEESFPFPWEDASLKISESLGLKNLKLIPQSSEWRLPQNCLSGMGSHPLILGIELSPLSHSMLWVTPQEAASELTSSTLSSDLQKEKFSDPRLQEAYYHFVMLQVLQIIDNLKILKDLWPQMIFSPSLPQEESLCIDIALSFHPKTIYGRLVIPRSCLNAFRTHTPFEKPSLLKRNTVKHLEFTLRLETGSITLDSEDWKKASPGDYIILDKSSYDPEQQKGSILMYLEGTPILQARIKPEGIKILDYIFYSEDNPKPTIKEPHPKHDPIPRSLNAEGHIEETDEEHTWATSSQEDPSEESEPMIPLKIDVEADHIRMSLEKILDLKPGHMLDVIVRPELGVNLLINNEPVGKGELLKLGDTVGVRLSHKSA